MSNDNKPAAAQEAVAWMTHHDEPMIFPTWEEAAMYCEGDEQPIPLYAAPVAAAPSAEAIELTVCCGREECGGECGNEWLGTEWVRKAATPAAPGIDLEQFRPAVCAMGLYAEEPGDVDEAKRLLALIDASPKGGAGEGIHSLPALATEKMLEAGWPRGEFIDDKFDKQGAYADLIAAAMQATSAEVGKERCESGSPDCGPVEHWDSEAVPLCARCWKELTASHGAGVSND